MNLDSIARALIIVGLGVCAALCVDAFVVAMATLNGLAAFTAVFPLLLACAFFGLVYQLALNTPEQQRQRGITDKAKAEASRGLRG